MSTKIQQTKKKEVREKRSIRSGGAPPAAPAGKPGEIKAAATTGTAPAGNPGSTPAEATEIDDEEESEEEVPELSGKKKDGKKPVNKVIPDYEEESGMDSDDDDDDDDVYDPDDNIWAEEDKEGANKLSSDIIDLIGGYIEKRNKTGKPVDLKSENYKTWATEQKKNSPRKVIRIDIGELKSLIDLSSVPKKTA